MAFSSAGTSRRVGLLAACALLAAAGAAVAQEGVPRRDAATEVGVVRIGLPEGRALPLAVTFGEGGVRLDLPRGSAFPIDFQAASGGLVRNAEIRDGGGDRLVLDLRLAAGLLESVVHEEGAVVLKFRRRVTSAAEDDDATVRYTIGPEDKILLTVTGFPDLSRQVVVGANGTIAAPLVGEVTAEGLSPRELAVKVTELLARDYLVDPQVDVEVVEYRSKWVMVTGEVRAPGRVPLRAASTLKDVVVDAGGLTSDAGISITISRQAGSGNSTESILVPRDAFEHGEANPEVQSGDIINVARKAYVYVHGEVRAPGRVLLEPGLTLLKALAIVGGLTEWANKREVQVLPENPNAPAAEYDVKDIERRKIEDPALRGGDTVVVRRRIL